MFCIKIFTVVHYSTAYFKSIYKDVLKYYIYCVHSGSVMTLSLNYKSVEVDLALTYVSCLGIIMQN
jgi:hypothetical protein